MENIEKQKEKIKGLEGTLKVYNSFNEQTKFRLERIKEIEKNLKVEKEKLKEMEKKQKCKKK